MIKRIVSKIRRSKKLLKEGVLPENVFNLYYENQQIKKSDFNQPVLSDDAANNWLREMIISGKPFYATRFGNAELGLVCNHMFNKLLNRNQWSDYSRFIVARDPAWNGDILQQESFYDSFLRSVSSIDAIGVWYNYGEQLMSNYICPKAVLFELPAYEPFFHINPWTLALEGKRVLIVHPYERSIAYQYQKKDIIFDFPVLPEFELITYKPFSTYNNDWMLYANAQIALHKMIEEVKNINFDIALVASGPYGLPLSAAIKGMNKQAVHIGGALQLFFGILGKRWEQEGRPQKAFFNEHWKRPYAEEIPSDPRVLKFSDDGCYW
jgi:hypothetical protein